MEINEESPLARAVYTSPLAGLQMSIRQKEAMLAVSLKKAFDQPRGLGCLIQQQIHRLRR
jgi:hypothetical protein